MPVKPKSVEIRFWQKVLKGPECWVWTASKNRSGYGQLNVSQQRPQLAHRLSYIFAFGEIPDGMLVCHSCDNPACVRPEHLFLGTYADNNHDMIKKGRRVKAWTYVKCVR